MNELTVVKHHGADLDAYRASTEAADVCKEIVVATSSMIQNRRYVSVEGWQAIAVAHGCAAGARDVERIEGGVRAIGEVRRMSDGQLIAVAEGFVGEDEETWFGGKSKWGKVLPKRNDYAIRAMAQTRAISRACRSAFAHVVVMMNAGLATTPAEEVPAEGFGDHNPQTGEVIQNEAVHREPVKGITKIKERLNKFMTEGNAAADLEAFRALKRANKDDLKTIRDANHSYWTGDGEDFEGFAAWMQRRTEELSPPEPSLQFTMLASLVGECTTADDLKRLLTEHGDAIGLLDGAESRRFEEIYDGRVDDLKSPTPITAEAFGG